MLRPASRHSSAANSLVLFVWRSGNVITRAGTPHTRAAWARGRGLDGETYLSVASSCAAPVSRRLVWGLKLWRGVPVCEQPPICC